MEAFAKYPGKLYELSSALNPKGFLKGAVDFVDANDDSMDVDLASDSCPCMLMTTSLSSNKPHHMSLECRPHIGLMCGVGCN